MRHVNVFRSAAGVVGLAITGLLQLAVPAPALATCPTISVDLPDRISVGRPYQQVNVPLVEACGASYVATSIYGPDGFEDIMIYDPASDGKLDYWDVYDSSIKPGSYYLRDGHAYDSEYNDMQVGDDATTVKFASAVSIVASRTGSNVKLTVTGRRYDAASERMVARPNATIGLRERVPGTATWKVTTYLKTSSSGVATVTLNRPYQRDWQAWFGATGSFWDATSGVVRK